MHAGGKQGTRIQLNEDLGGASRGIVAPPCPPCLPQLPAHLLGSVSAGPALPWRPLGRQRWAALRADLASAAAALADAYNAGREASGLNFALEVDVVKVRSCLLRLASLAN